MSCGRPLGVRVFDDDQCVASRALLADRGFKCAACALEIRDGRAEDVSRPVWQADDLAGESLWGGNRAWLLVGSGELDQINQPMR